MSEDDDNFNIDDLDMDLSFLHPANSPGATTIYSSCSSDSSMAVDNVSTRHAMPTVVAPEGDNLRPNDTSSLGPHLLNNSRIPPILPASVAVPPASKSLASWTFNKKKRKHIYVSLTGKKLTGPMAIRQCREDKASAAHPFRLARADLVQSVLLIPSHFTAPSTSKRNDDDAHLLLTDWGVPASTAVRYAEVGGVRSMFRWQRECLSVDGGACVLRGGNLIYSAPTSGGKTLVAEVLMLRRLGGQQSGPSPQLGLGPGPGPGVEAEAAEEGSSGVILFVVPFISLAEEKAAYFQDRWKLMFIGVRSFHGEDDGASLTDDVDVAVCTFEKANVLVNQLLDEGRGGRLSMVVVDELHLVSDAHRGFLLEVLLTKVKHCMPHCQIVGMSATLPNMSDLATWLDASLFTTSFRPVQLAVRVCCERKLHEVGRGEAGEVGEVGFRLDRAVPSLQALLRTHAPSAAAPPSLPPRHTHTHTKPSFASAPSSLDDDDEGFLSLVFETLLLKKSVMVFCNSKRRCELCVDRIAKMLKSVEASKHSGDRSGSSDLVAKRLQLLQQLRETPVGLCPLLHASLIVGVAYHHAGLTMDERALLEGAYRAGVVVALCTTSTLAAGVNLPAHRVIIRTPTMMCGRAGRLGLDDEGEAVLMLPNGSRASRELAVHLVTADMPPLLSSLQTAHGGGLEKLLLEMIYCQQIKSPRDVERFVASTLMSVQQAAGDVQSWTRDALHFLQQHQFLLQYSQTAAPEQAGAVSAPSCSSSSSRGTAASLLGGGHSLAASPLGRATTLSGVSPKDAVLVLSSLQQARKKLILQSGFHVIFLVTPPCSHIQPHWDSYEMLLDGVLTDHPGILPVVQLLGASRGDLCHFKHSPPKFNCTKPKSLFYKRFYSALLLFNLVQEIPLNKISQWVDVQRGQLQQLQKEASAFCGMIVSFCEKLNWQSLKCVLSTYTSRLMFGVKPELLPLTRLGAEMPGFRARAFFKSGIKSIDDIVSSSPDFIRNILLDCLPFEGADPLRAGKRRGSGGGSSSSSGGGARRQEEQSCASLAVRIIKLGKAKLQQDMALQYQERQLLHNGAI